MNIEVNTDSLKLSDDMRQSLAGAESLPEGVTVESILENHNANSNAAYREVLAQDSDFTKAFYDEGAKKTKGEILGTLDNQLKAAGYAGDFEDDRGRIPYSKIFSSFRDQFDKGTKGDTAVKEWQEKYAAQKTQYDNLQASIDAGELQAIKDARQEVEAYRDRESRVNNMAHLRSLLPNADELNIQFEDVVTLVASQLDANYQWGEAENGFEIRMKDGSYPMAGSGQEVIKDASKIINGIIDSRKYRKVSNGKPDPEKIEVQIKDNLPKVHPSAQKRAEEQAAR